MPVLGTIDALETVVGDSTGAAGGRKSWSSPRRVWPARPMRRLLDRADALAIPLARLPQPDRFHRTRSARPSASSSRSRSRICSAARRPCSTATAMARPDPRPARARHRRRRHDRLRTGAPDRGPRAGRLILRRQQRVPALRRSTAKSRERFPELPCHRCSPMCATAPGSRRVIAAEQPRDRVPRRRAEARADGRGQPDRGRADQRHRHPQRRRGGARLRRRGDGRHDLDRQGGQPDQRHGRHQAPGRELTARRSTCDEARRRRCRAPAS